MREMIFILGLLCLSGFAFGTGAARTLGRIILIGGGIVTAVIAGAFVFGMLVHS